MRVEVNELNNILFTFDLKMSTHTLLSHTVGRIKLVK